jgi:hypothetical protein
VEQGRRLICSVGVMEVEIVFTGVPVTRLDAGRNFFERLFAAPPMSKWPSTK